MKAIRRLVLLGTALLAPRQSAAQDNGFQVRLGVVGASSKRSAAVASVPGTESGMLGGVSCLARFRVVGLSVRAWGGKFNEDRVATGDASLLLGVRAISMQVGYGRRAFTDDLGTVAWSYAKIGARSEVPIGSAGIYGGIAAAAYTRVKQRGGGGTGSGAEGDTWLAYFPARAPFYVQTGYSIQRFTARIGSTTVPEHVSGISVAVGYRFRHR